MIKRRAVLAGLSSAALITACSAENTPSHTGQNAKVYNKARLDIYDARFNNYIAPDAKVELLAEGFKWTEGPAWDSKREHLYFSDIPNNRIHSWNRKSGLKIFLYPAGRDKSPLDTNTTPGTNGILYTADDDSILICNQNARSVDVLDLNTTTREAVAAEFNGKAFNSPNDIVRASDGTLYFTDPPYGLKDQINFQGQEQPHFGVYRLRNNGKVELITDDLIRPNGIALSPDNRTLYVSQSDTNAPIIENFTLSKTGEVLGRGKFADFSDIVGDENPGLPDGMAVDENGVLFVTGPGGVLIMSPKGERLGRIHTGRATANCAFGEDGSTLFMTAHDTLLAIPTLTKGLGFS